MTYYALYSEHIAKELFDDEIVIIDLQTGTYFGLSKSGTYILGALLEGASDGDLEAAVNEHQSLCTDYITSFIAKLIDHKVIKAMDDNQLSYDSKKLATQLLACQDVPQVDVYNDLADLILADPVHDVDENAGWPIKNNEA